MATLPPRREVSDFGPMLILKYPQPDGQTRRVYMERVVVEALQRFMVAEGDCWVWEGPLTSDGRACLVHDGHTLLVHRLVYCLEHGPLSDRIHLIQTCRNLRCIRPSHQMKSERGPTGRVTWTVEERQSHNCCKWGHPLTPDNIYTTGDGKQQCRACRTEAQRRLRAREQRNGSGRQADRAQHPVVE